MTQLLFFVHRDIVYCT